MVTHTLNLESTTLDQDVLCVTTVLPSYLFVFHLNQLLGLSLVRSKEDLKAENTADRFAVYEYNCEVMQAVVALSRKSNRFNNDQRPNRIV